MEYFEEYDGINKSWLEEIIEIALNSGGTCHYLSHPARIKNSSLSTEVQSAFDASLKDELNAYNNEFVKFSGGYRQ